MIEDQANQLLNQPSLPSREDDKGGEVSSSVGTNGGSASESTDRLCIHHWFEQQVAQQPNTIAVCDASIRLTYGELNHRSNQLARQLRASGVRANTLVGLCTERQADMVIGILGILKAGGAYLPLDPACPKDRVAYILADAQISILVSQTKPAAALALEGIRVVSLDGDNSKLDCQSGDTLDSGTTPADLAYVIYTSGSTGKPKGALITHHNVVRLFTQTAPWFHFDHQDVWTLFHSSAFDFSVWEIWGALLYGGRLVIVPFEITRSPDDFYRLLCRERVTVLSQTPSAFRQLIRAEESVGQYPDLALRTVVFGGEPLDMKTLQPWFARHGDQRPQLVNMYGITETTVHVTYRPLTGADVTQSSVIGVPIPDLTLYLLDDGLLPVAPGETGEICVGGAGLGRGYLNRPELTAQRFVEWSGERLYRSGDLGRRLANGDLEYLGRKDHQVKIRGFRIELGEIESVLNSHPSVRESVVLARDDARGEKRLIAYVIARPGATIEPLALRQMLRSGVPEYMVPTVFAAIHQLPLTPNGKLDVDVLPNPSADAGFSPTVASSDSPPRSELEEKIAAIWQEVLARPNIGRDQSFFDIGGNSIRLAEVHGKMQGMLGTTFPITKLFQYSTVRSQAAHFNGSGVSEGANQTVLDRVRRQREALAQRSAKRR